MITLFLHLYPIEKTNETHRGPCKRKRRNETTDQVHQEGDILLAKNNVSWKVSSPDINVGRVGAHNVLRETPGPTSYAIRNIKHGSCASAFHLLIDKHIIDIIKQCTEIEARMKTGNADWTITSEEIYKFIAISYARGVLAKGRPMKSLWSKRYGIPFFKAMMSRNRYSEILRYIRFDIRSERSTRLQTDKFALCSAIWERFIENCMSCYRPGKTITIDEQLFPTKCRYPFTQYIASKPDKFGIKFWLAVDSETKYLVNGFPYLGKDAQRPQNESLSEFVVMKLMEPYLGKGRNVTTDNFFTSLNLAKRLLQKNTTIVGTLNRIRKEVPAAIKTSKAPLYSSTILNNEGITLTVYQGKTSKNVLLLSSIHKTVSISEGRKRRPESVEYYNATKFGVDVLDQMARLYTCKVSSRRWPLQVFYNVLDLAGVNAHVLYRHVTNEKIARRTFLINLCEELGGLRESSDSESDEDDDEPVVSPVPVKKRSPCNVLCKKPKRNLTAKKCNKCKRNVCGKCTARTVLYCKLCK